MMIIFGLTQIRAPWSETDSSQAKRTPGPETTLAQITRDFERIAAEQGWKDHYPKDQLDALQGFYTALRTNPRYNQSPVGALYWTNAFAERKGLIFKEQSLVEKYDFSTEEMLGVLRLTWQAEQHPEYGKYYNEQIQNGYRGDAVRYVLDSMKTALQLMGAQAADRKSDRKIGDLMTYADWADPSLPKTKYFRAMVDSAKTEFGNNATLWDKLQMGKAGK